jgi:cytochrome P450
MRIFRDISDGRAFRRDPLAFRSAAGEFHDVMRFRAGFTDFTLVNHPDLIRRVLVTDAPSYGEGKWTLRGKRVLRDCLITREGTLHHERRRFVGPGFDRRRLAQFGPALTRCAERATVDWQSGRRIEVRGAMGSMAITMAGIALFDADLEAEASELIGALDILNNSISRLPLPRPRVAMARRRVERTAASFLDGYLASHLRDNGMSEGAVLNELISLMMAAVETTPRALAWFWFLLGRNHCAELHLHEELKTVLGSRSVAVGELTQLHFMEMMLSETLRLYPPVHFIDRRTLKEVELAGVRIPAESYLLLSPLVTHRDPRFFEDPDAFKPERWGTREPPALSFPFGAGAHRCIGEELARLEISLAIATIARSWRLLPEPEIPANPSPQTPRLSMILERRSEH